MKLSKKKSDIIFIDPKTMQPRCSFNQCVKKFTIEDYDVKILDSGKEFVSAFHACNECGQRVKAKGDGTKGYQEWLKRRLQAEELDSESTVEWLKRRLQAEELESQELAMEESNK
jgi:predicted nucleotidyltransferase